MLVLLGATLVVAGAQLVLVDPAPAAVQPEPRPLQRPGDGPPGRELYVVGCSSCHGLQGEGTDRGPSLRQSGAAAAYYYLTTGRMPLTEPAQPVRKPPAYTPEQIERLVYYVSILGDGPPIPDVDPEAGALALGGVLYRGNCAPCHNAAGIGGALSYGRAAPSIRSADPLVVASAMLIGPGEMPVFGPPTFNEHEVDSIVRYALYLQNPPDPGGIPLGGVGPVPEGLAAWLLGMGALLLAVAWIGTRARPS